MKRVLAIVFAVLLFGAALLPAHQPAGSNSADHSLGRASGGTNVANALSLEKQGKLPEALAAWQSVVKTQPRNAQAYAQLGLLESRMEHYDAAIAAYRKALALNAKIPQLNLNLGLALFKSGKFTESAKLFQSELKLHPDDQRLTILVGMSQYGAHDYAGAIPYLKQAATRDQRNLPLRLTLAHCYLWTKQFDATMGVYKEILEIDPDSAEADMIAGEALDEKGDNAGAVQQFLAAEKANPKEPDVHFGLAYLLWAQKRYEEAVPEFKAELENDPHNYQAMVYLGDTYVRAGEFDKAREVLEKAAPYEQSEPLIHLDMGIVYQETGDKEKAIREFGETVRMEPDNVDAHFRLAQTYRSMGKKDEAKVEFAKASSLNKKTDDALYNRIAAANARPADSRPDDSAKPEKPSASEQPDSQAKPNPQ